MTELVPSRALSGIGGGGMQTWTLLLIFTTHGRVSKTFNHRIVSIIVSDVYFCEIGAHIKVGSNVPLKSYININWLIGFLNIFVTGNTVGASLGGYISDTIGWRLFVTTSIVYRLNVLFTPIPGLFLLQEPVTITGIISVTLALQLPKTDTSDLMVKFKRVDWAGAISLILTVFLLLFDGGNVSWNDRLTIYSLAAFPICFICFAVIKKKFASEPFAPQQIILQAVFGQTASLGWPMAVNRRIRCINWFSWWWIDHANNWQILPVNHRLIFWMAFGCHCRQLVYGHHDRHFDHWYSSRQIFSFSFIYWYYNEPKFGTSYRHGDKFFRQLWEPFTWSKVTDSSLHFREWGYD